MPGQVLHPNGGTVVNGQSGERTRLAYWRSRPRDREICFAASRFRLFFAETFRRGRRKEHARRVRSLETTSQSALICVICGQFESTFPTQRWPHVRSGPRGGFRIEHRAQCQRVGPRLDGQHACDLWRDNRRSGAALDEGTKCNRRLADCRILDVAVFNDYAKAARHFERSSRWAQHRDPTADRALAARSRRS